MSLNTCTHEISCEFECDQPVYSIVLPRTHDFMSHDGPILIFRPLQTGLLGADPRRQTWEIPPICDNKIHCFDLVFT